MAEGGVSGFHRSPSLDNANPLTPPLERSAGANSVVTNLLNPRSSHSLSRLTPGLPTPTVAALQRFATYSPRHDFAYPSPPPSPITLRSLRVRDDVNIGARSGLTGRIVGGDDLSSSSSSSTAAAVSPHHPHHPVRKRLSQRLAAWSKNFKAKFKKSGGDATSTSAGSSPSSSTKLGADVASLKQELLMDRVVASDGRSCTLTRRHQLSSDLPALLRSSSSSPRPSHHHHPLHDLNSSLGGGSRFRGATGIGAAGGGGGRADVASGVSQPVAVESRSSKRDPLGDGASDSRTPVGIVQSSAFIVTTTSSSSPSSTNKMMSSVVVESSPSLVVDALSTSIRSEGGIPVDVGLDLFERRRRERPFAATDDEDGGEEEDEDAGGGVDDENDLPPPELPPRRRRVQSTDNILDLPADRSLSSASQITTSLTTDDVASLREGGASRSTSDVFAKSIERLKECGWYWGPLSWEEASIILKDKLDGSFLVRDSSDDRYILSLSIRCNGRTLHTRIQHYKGLFSFWQQPWTHGCDTIVDFIERCMMHSRDGSFMYFLRPAGMANMAPMPLLLLHPVSRLFKVPSLHHLSRFAILKIVRRDNVDDLPLPPRLKEYLLEPQYLFEDLISGGEVEEEDGEEPVLTGLRSNGLTGLRSNGDEGGENAGEVASD